MAPTVVAVCRSSLRTQSRDAMEMGYEKRSSLASDVWVCQPTVRLIRLGSGVLSTGSACATRTGSFQAKTLALDISHSAKEEEEEVLLLRGEPVCETPKAKKHRIPVVDVDLCPPAPKKPRAARGRLPAACSSERESSTFLQKLSFSPSYLF